MQLIANAKQQFIDQNGAPLANGSVYFYAPGTTNPMSTYQDKAGTILNTNPVLLDSRGQAVIWGSGTYRQVVKDSGGVTIWDQITQDANAGLLGSITDNVFVSGVDFTPGTTASLTLNTNPGSISNTWIYFDGAYQDDSQAALNETTLTFATPIPVGVSKVTVKVGTTTSIGTPNTGSVVDKSVSSGSALHNRLTQMVSVMDPAYGAKGDGVTDDTSAIQACISANAYVFFPPGKTFKTTASIVVPTTCKRIDGAGAWMVGPGYTSTVDGFTFSGCYQGGGDIQVQSELYTLPSLKNFRYGVYLYNSGFLRIYSDTIRNCVTAYFCTCDSASAYCFELDLRVRFAWHLRDAANTTGAAFYMQMTGDASSSYQGNYCWTLYADDCYAAVYQDFSSTGTGGNINNLYDILECDQCKYAVYNTKANSSFNLFRFPMGITSPQSANMFVNWDTQDSLEVCGINTNDPSIAAANNFQWIGCTNRLGINVQSGGIPTLYVDPAGNDATGTGHDSAPFRTIQRALNVLAPLDLFGQTVYISVRDGSYTGGAQYNAIGGASCNGTIAIIGNQASPANVTVNGSFVSNGQGANILVSGVTIVGGGLLSQNGGIIQIGPGVVFGAFAGGIHINSNGPGSQIQINSNYTVNGVASNHMVASVGGLVINSAASTVTCSGTLPFTTFAIANAGTLWVPGLTISGSGVSGARYVASMLGVLWTNGGGANYFPGTVAGSTVNGGQYA
jgi:hypothetical protein